MKPNFLFLDESYSEPIDNKDTTISTITGILLPIDKYPEARTRYYQKMQWVKA